MSIAEIIEHLRFIASDGMSEREVNETADELEALTKEAVAWMKCRPMSNDGDQRCTLAQDYEFSGGYGLSADYAQSAGYFPLFAAPPPPEFEARLVSHAPNGSTCTLNIDGVERYYNESELEAVADNLAEELGEIYDAVCFTSDYIGKFRYERNKSALDRYNAMKEEEE